ncbi:MAG: cytochrome c3 family protein [Desulfuromonadales bacterium]|jgi:hypothetical protein
MSAKQIVTTLMTVFTLVIAVSLAQAFDSMPGQVTIDVMAEYFDGVEFDHEMHTELGEDCSACHHHATGTGTTDERCVRCHADSDEVAEVGCSDCHFVDTFSAEHINREAADVYQFHIDTPGLKAAYHWSCLGCHEQMDGPTGCQDCHARTSEGDAFYHADAHASSGDGGGH